MTPRIVRTPPRSLTWAILALSSALAIAGFVAIGLAAGWGSACFLYGCLIAVGAIVYETPGGRVKTR